VNEQMKLKFEKLNLPLIKYLKREWDEEMVVDKMNGWWDDGGGLKE